MATVAGTIGNFTAGDVTVSNYKQSSDLEIKVKVTDAATGTADGENYKVMEK